MSDNIIVFPFIPSATRIPPGLSRGLIFSRQNEKLKDLLFQRICERNRTVDLRRAMVEVDGRWAIRLRKLRVGDRWSKTVNRRSGLEDFDWNHWFWSDFEGLESISVPKRTQEKFLGTKSSRKLVETL